MLAAKKVVNNTGYLYVRMIITILVSLYSTRLILSALGESDYGIFSLIAGVIALLSFINSGMSVATSRYISFYLGANYMEKLKAAFSSSVLLHLLIGITIVILLEIGGVFLFNGVLNIPEDRIHTAKIIYQCMVVSTFFSINAAPYSATIGSHENMLYLAVVGIVESFAKLGIAIVLVHAKTDKLILYGLLMAALSVLVRIVMSVYCQRKYEECRVKVRSHYQINLVKEMLLFAGWNVYSMFCYVLNTQGMNVLLNLFFGVKVNAAYGIANQVNGTLSSFSTNMIKAFLPQIFKSGGSGNNERMLKLSMLSSKLSIFLLALFALPIFLEMDFVINLWLKDVPEYTVIFCRLVLIICILQQPAAGLMAAITAVGNIKTYQLVTGSIQFFNIPIAYGLIKLGLPPYSVLIGSIFLEFINTSLVIWFAHTIAGLNVRYFVINTLGKSFLSVILAAFFALLVMLLLDKGLIRALTIGIITTSSLLILGKYIAFTRDENNKISEIITSIFISIKGILSRAGKAKLG